MWGSTALTHEVSEKALTLLFGAEALGLREPYLLIRFGWDVDV